MAIIELDGTLSVGDKIKFVKNGQDYFEQVVESIQVEHEKKETALKGDVIGLKTEKEVKEGVDVFKM